MIKPYLSYSEVWKFKQNPNEYFVEYIMGIRPEPNDAMKFGSIIHKAINKECDIEKELTKEMFTANFIRVGKQLIKTAKKMPFQELELVIKGNKKNRLKCPLMVVFDGVDFETNTILERKTTKSGWSNQDQVDESEQLTWYALAYRELKELLPRIELERLCSSNGQVKLFNTERNNDQIEVLVDNINEIYNDLVSRSWWQRRIMQRDKFYQKGLENFKKYAYNTDTHS